MELSSLCVGFYCDNYIIVCFCGKQNVYRFHPLRFHFSHKQMSLPEMGLRWPSAWVSAPALHL